MERNIIIVGDVIPLPKAFSWVDDYSFEINGVMADDKASLSITNDEALFTLYDRTFIVYQGTIDLRQSPKIIINTERLWYSYFEYNRTEEAIKGLPKSITDIVSGYADKYNV